MNDTCICDNVPKVWRLTGVTRTLRLRIFNPDGTPLDLTGRTVAVTIARDNSEFSYAPGFVIEGDDGNVVKFEWPADKQGAGDYTINVTATDGSGNVDRVNWHGPTGIRLVDFSFMVRGEDALGVTSEANIGLDGTFTMNGTGMSAYDEWLAEGHTGTPEEFIAWLRQPAVDAASAAEAQMGQIQERADADHTRAGNDHTTAGQDHTRAGNDHTTATDDHRIAAADHSTATDDHTLAASDHGTAAEDHRVAGIDHGTAADDHTRAGQDHQTASDDHTQAGSDHTRAGEDHTRAGDDHTTASGDHTRAGEDHTTAGSDHTRAGEDHTQAGNDHTRAEADHGIAADDHTQATADHAVMAGYDTRLGNVEGEVSQLGQSINGRERQETIVDLSQYPSINYIIPATNRWTKSPNYSKLIPVTPGQRYRFDKGTNPGVIAILTSNSVIAGTTPSYSSEYPSRITNIPDEIIIPADGAYLYTVRETSSGNVTLQVYLVESERIVGLEERVETNTDNISEIQDRFDVFDESLINTSGLDKYSKYISEDAWVSAGASNATRCSFVPVVGNRTYKLVSNNVGSCRYVFLKVNTPGTGSATGDYAGDITETSLLPVGETVNLLAPADAVSLYVVRINSSSADVTPSVYANSSIENVIDDIDIEIANLDDAIYRPIDLTQYDANPYVLLSNGNFQSVVSSSTQSCIMIPIIPGYQYRVKANSSGAIMAVLTTTMYPGNNMPASFATGYTSRLSLSDSEEYIFTAPIDGRCLYLLKEDSSGTDRLPTYVKTNEIRIESSDTEGLASLQQMFDNIPIAIDANGWEIPTTGGMVNALKKAAQACDIVYNAKSTYPTNSSDTGGAAGEHTGFPYSSTKQIRKYIGWEVSQRTFMTAVNNPYSLFYTENISSVRSKSGYGFTYSGVNCGSYYGMACSIFAEWALGFKIPYETFNFAYLARIGKLVKIADQSAQGVHICDLLWQSGHTMLVTGVQRDQYGNVINVITSESKSNVKATTRTAANFNSYLSTNSCIIYRPTEIYKNTEYVPSEFVAVRGESTPPAYVYNDDICFFAGDYAAWRVGDDCWLNYTKGNYSSVKIYKGDTLVQTVSLDADATVHKLDVTSYMDGAGKYKACLTDGTTDSDYAYWELVDTTVSYANGRVSFASTNGTPWWAQICSATGVTFCFYEISDADITNGYADVDFAQLIADQEGDATGTLYLRVMFKGDYGGVVSVMQQVTL